MSEEKDEKSWNELWRKLETPDPIDGDDRARDPRTAAATAWMKAAWGALECPAPPVARRGRRLRFPPALAAVAALVLALLGALAFQQGNSGSRPPVHEIARDLGATEDATGTETAKVAVGRRVTASGEIELKKGRLRLLLVSPTPNPPEDPEEN